MTKNIGTLLSKNTYNLGEAVAYGTAVQADVLGGEKDLKIQDILLF